MALRYRAERQTDRVKVVDTETGKAGFYSEAGNPIMIEAGMPETLNDQAVLDQLYWSVIY